MPDKKISQLASGTNAQAGDLFVIARSGANYSLTTAQLFNAPSATATLAALTVDTDTLCVDATNNRVSVGATALSASNNYGVPQLGTTADVYSTFHVESHHDTAGNYSFIGLMRSRGTRTAPTHLQSGDPIGIVTAQVYNDAGSFPYREAASIQFIAAGNHAAGSLPASISFRTTPSGSNSPSERMRLDASGNLGLGVTPSAWDSTYRVLQLGSHASFNAWADLVSVASNIRISSGNAIYLNNGEASQYLQYIGTHRFLSAASGTAGATATLVERMRLDASGNLGIGSSSPAGRLHITGSTASFIFNTTGTELYSTNSGSVKFYASNAAGFLSFGAGGRDNDLILSAAGNLGLGVTPSAWGSGGFMQFGSGKGIGFGGNAYFFANAFSGVSGNTYIATGVAAQYAMEGAAHKWFTAPSGTAGNAITFTQAMTLDASGNLIVGNTTANFGAAGRGVIEINGSSQALLGFNTVGSARGYVAHTGTDMSVWNSASGSITFASANVSRWQINSSGHLLAGADATYDIGASGATRPRDLFLSRNLTLDGLLTSGNMQVGTVSADLSNVSQGLVGYANNHPTYANGALILQSRSSTARPIVFVTGATTGTARMSVKEDGQVRFVPLAAAPTTNVEDGDVYYDSGTNKLRVRAGGAWVDLH